MKVAISVTMVMMCFFSAAPSWADDVTGGIDLGFAEVLQPGKKTAADKRLGQVIDGMAFLRRQARQVYAATSLANKVRFSLDGGNAAHGVIALNTGSDFQATYPGSAKLINSPGYERIDLARTDRWGRGVSEQIKATPIGTLFGVRAGVVEHTILRHNAKGQDRHELALGARLRIPLTATIARRLLHRAEVRRAGFQARRQAAGAKGLSR